MSKCCLWTCSQVKIESPLSFFKFPERGTLRFLQWVEAVNKPLDFFSRSRRYLCSLHFDESDFDQSSIMKRKLMPEFKTRLVLKKNAVPSKLLTSDQTDNDLKLITNNDFDDPIEVQNNVNYCENIKTEILNPDVEIIEIEDDTFTDSKENDVKPEEDEFDELNIQSSANIIIKEESFFTDNGEELKEDAEEKDVDDCDQLTCFDSDELDSSANLESDSSDKKFTCNRCKARFRWGGELRRHKFIEHGSCLCPICKKKLNSLTHLRIHQRRKHDINNVYHCETCGMGFSKIRVYQNHLRFHEIGPRCQEWKCRESEDCETVHKCPELKNRHECKLCCKIFTTKNRFITHKNKFHCEFLCIVCRMKFFNQSDLRLHLAEHTGLICQECNVMFEDIEDLQRHNRNHFRFRCDICDACFANTRNYNVHMAMHYGAESKI